MSSRSVRHGAGTSPQHSPESSCIPRRRTVVCLRELSYLYDGMYNATTERRTSTTDHRTATASAVALRQIVVLRRRTVVPLRRFCLRPFRAMESRGWRFPGTEVPGSRPVPLRGEKTNSPSIDRGSESVTAIAGQRT